MATSVMDVEGFATIVAAAARPTGRPLLVAMAGPPGVGKSTAVQNVHSALIEAGVRVGVVPMDGFHLANDELARLGRSDCKGAPDTFDVDGLAALLGRLHTGPSSTVWAPRFDRSLEAAIAGSIAVEPATEIVLVEGNYLLLDESPWDRVSAQFDLRAYLHPADEAGRVQSLIARHIAHGRSPADALEWVMRSDEANARIVEATRANADVIVTIRFA